MPFLFCWHAINISPSILRYNRVTGQTTNMPSVSVPERSFLEITSSGGAVQAQVQRLRFWITMLIDAVRLIQWSLLLLRQFRCDVCYWEAWHGSMRENLRLSHKLNKDLLWSKTDVVSTFFFPSFPTLFQATTREAETWFSFKDDTGRMIYINLETGEEQYAKPDCKKKYSARP